MDALGPIDLLVNNAGVIETREVPIWEADPDEWWDVVETDLAARRGRAVNLNSGAGAADRPVYSAYCAAKAGLFRLSGNLHLAGADLGLRAFEVSPGVDTPQSLRHIAATAKLAADARRLGVLPYGPDDPIAE